MGLAEAGDSINLVTCDVNDRNDPNCLCWHITDDEVRPGPRCGVDDWKHMVWHTDVSTSSMTYTHPQYNDCKSDYIGSFLI